MDIISSLLLTRNSIIKELRDVEGLLKARGWDGCSALVGGALDQPHNESRVPVSPQEKPDAVTPSRDIAYNKEVHEWLGMVDSEFTAVDFRNWLVGKYGETAVNSQSARGPFAALKRQGVIQEVRPGAGRTPSVYRRGPHFNIKEFL